MAKKSATARHGSAPRRPTTSGSGAAKRPTTDQSRVTLVRSSSAGTTTIADDRPTAKPAATAPKPAASKPAVTSMPKPASGGGVVGPAANAPAKPATSAPARPAVQAATAAAARPAAARGPQRPTRPVSRARANALVTPEHYAYVRNDLIRTAVLAASMFLIIVIAYFVLRAHGMA